MKLLISLIIVIFSFTAHAGGVSGGGVGPRPQPDQFSIRVDPSIKVDLVKNLGLDSSGTIKFGYKKFESDLTEIHQININELADNYFEAIKKSQQTGSWEPVDLE